MTDLTEQMHKGELPEGYYYIKDGENMIAEYLDGYFYNNGEPITSFSGGVDSVLAPVPSYEEWKEYQELDEDNKKNMQLAIRFSIEAEILRELLKEIRQQITEQVFGSPELQLFEGTFDNKLLAKIDEVLK